MRLKLPKYVHGWINQHGKASYYLRKPGTKQVKLDGVPYSPEFMEDYRAKLGGLTIQRRIGAERTMPGTVNAAIISYVHSQAWQQLSKGTHGARRAILERFREDHGDKPISKMSARALMVILESKKPHAKRNWLKTLRGLCQHSKNIGLMTEDPTANVKLAPAPRSKGFHTWDESEIQQFEKHFPVGTKQRLALTLLLYTGLRRSDIVKIGRQHEQNGCLRVIPEKTERYGTELLIPMHPELRAVINATPSEHLNYLVTDYGKPFTKAGFGGWFADQCKAAGIPDVCRAHGLRKAICRRLAEAGCTAPQIAAISGHMSLREVQRYIEAANRTKMAQEGMATLTRVFSSTENENRQWQTVNKGLPIPGKNP